ncbi:MAG: hypothetical protein ACKOX3_09820 [Bacteroidota bacterium]
MNLKKALKEKNKLKGKINETFSRIGRYNITEEGIERPYDPQQLLTELFVKVEEIVSLKTKIQRANTEVFEKIFLLSELKNVASKMKYLSCDKERLRSSSEANSFNDVSITTNERDALIEKIEKQIEQIQEELDEFNYRTKI